MEFCRDRAGQLAGGVLSMAFAGALLAALGVDGRAVGFLELVLGVCLFLPLLAGWLRRRRFYRAVERHWAPLMRERAQTYPGVPEMLGELKEQGYVLAVCSNAKEEELEDVLGVLSIREYFDYIQGLTSRQDKADSLGVLIERAGADWCCMVGDRFYDREAAKANETAFIGCRYGYGGADEFGDGDLLAEDSVEIPGLLKRLVFSTPWLKPWQRP